LKLYEQFFSGAVEIFGGGAKMAQPLLESMACTLYDDTMIRGMKQKVKH